MGGCAGGGGGGEGGDGEGVDVEEGGGRGGSDDLCDGNEVPGCWRMEIERWNGCMVPVMKMLRGHGDGLLSFGSAICN